MSELHCCGCNPEACFYLSEDVARICDDCLELVKQEEIADADCFSTD